MRIATILMAAAVSIAAAPAPTVEQLGWLSGSWASQSGEDWTEEQWMVPRGGMMLGTNRSGKGAKATGFEYMQIAADEKGRISYWALPSGQPAVPFALVSSGRNQAVFENPKNDYPTRIVYRRDGKVLRASVSGPGGANKLEWKFSRR